MRPPVSALYTFGARVPKLIRQMTSIALRYRVTRRSQPPKYSWGTDLLLWMLAIVSTVGAIAAGVVHSTNAERLTRYEHDLTCSAPLTAPGVRAAGACSVEQSQVTARWIHARRSS